ncbi:MAG: FAD-dependent monooxygenase [Rubrivivax sp.]|nr:FAD-dependent monooxygenase [Rubrivivax sp.]
MSGTVRMAVVGGGPVGLALALLAARLLPRAEVTLFDARAASHDVSPDPRTLALALGSVQLLQRLQAWPAAAAQPILEVQVSQAPPSLAALGGRADVHIRAAEEGVPMLGAVLPYGALVATLQRVWQAEVDANPQRLCSRLGTAVNALTARSGSVEVDAGIAEGFDLAVVAEGGVFADQARKALSHDYRQTAWVGELTLETSTPACAFERFTRHGPVALLPLAGGAPGRQRAGLVWCVPSDDDPVRGLDDAQRLAVLATVLPPQAGRLLTLAPLKSFPLGLNAERSLVEGRIVRIGNAAQTLHPVAGQGLNLGLRDAYALVAALRFQTDIDSALRRIEWARAPDRWAMIATTDFLARSFTWGLPGLTTARAVALAALQAAPPLKSWLARRMMFGSR